MNDWKDIHEDFTPELQKQWEDLNFTYLKVQEWIEKGSLTPEDAGFAYFLASTSYAPEDMDDKNLDQLRENYRDNFFFQQRVRLEDWRNIHFDFTPELVKAWRNFGFTLQQTREWINVGMSVNDASLCAWLESYKLVDAEWVLNFGNYQELKEEYQQKNLLIAQQIQNKN
ncbi:MAG: serine/threonine protein kinase [Mycoplasmataceae bacterium RC_NB112A]|nr:MAG: serine/threonine protein kinase [Mycoplasmataceae bacterium RC_NB112A]